jgi:hypothetical protein
MSASTQRSENPLESAANQLRTICRDRELLTSPIDAGSVARMVVHITNIHSSVLASTQDHVNGAKRLNDFALAVTRIARNSEPPNGALAAQMTSVANDLRAASEELAGADAIPKWKAPAAHNG